MTAPRADVTLEKLAARHAERTLAWVKDPEVAEGLALRGEPSLDRTLAFIRRSETDASVRAFAILRGGEHVGNVVLDDLDPRAGSTRLSIYVGARGERGAGVGLAAVLRALETAFADPAINRVWLTVHAANAAAIRVYEKAGFVREGVLREAFLVGGARTDGYLMAILRRELGRWPR